jgi:hypothetical protein
VFENKEQIKLCAKAGFACLERFLEGKDGSRKETDKVSFRA